MALNIKTLVDAYATKTDFVHINYAADVNNLQNALDQLSYATLSQAGFANTETLGANKTLTDDSPTYQYLNPNTANRVVTLPAVAATNKPFVVSNTNGAAYTLDVQNASAVSIRIIRPSRTHLFISDGVSWKAVGADAPENVNPSVADNFVSFNNTTGEQKNSGKGLTHLVYTLQTITAGGVNPADASTYYFGGDGGTTTGTNIRRIYFPFSGTIVYAQVNIQVLGTLGDATTFSCYVRINNTTDLTVTSSAKADAVFQQYQATLATAVTGGTDYFEGKVVFPTWPTTNPTTVKVYFILGIQV